MSDAEIDRLRRRESALMAANTALRVLLTMQASGAAGDAGPGPRPIGPGRSRPAYEVLAAAIETTRTAIVVTDPTLPDNPIIFSNSAFHRLSGYAEEELFGRNCRFMQGPATDPEAVACIRTAIRDRQDITVDILNYRKDGTSFVNELYLSPVLGPDGDLAYFFGCQIDATAYRTTAQRLVGNEGRWLSRFERLQEGFMLGDLVRDAAGHPVDWRYLEVNTAWQQLTGLSREAALGRCNAEILPDLDPAWVVDFAAVVETGEPLAITRWVPALRRAYEARIFRPETGQFAMLFQDVTDRLREEARRDTLLKLSDVLREDTHPDELAYRGAALLGRALGVSRAGYGTIDPEAETVIISPDWHAPGISSIAGTLRFRDYGSYIEDLKAGVTVAIADTRQDPRTIETSATLEAISVRSFVNMPITEQGGFVALLFLNHAEAREWRDDELSLIREVAERTRVVVERRRAEQALQALTTSLEAEVQARTRDLMSAEEALRQSQKMEAVGQLTGGIAHDFNNLLTGIIGSLELLNKRIAQGRTDGVDRYSRTAQDAAQRAAALTHRLLAFSRRQTLDPNPTDLNALIGGMEELIRRTVGPSITIKVTAAEQDWPALVDANQLENALLNLCINARDAMPDGGRITIETSGRSMDARLAKNLDLQPGQYVVLSVSDTGTGMTPETVSRAFDPFFTTKPLGQGTGLGLSMIHGFVRQSGGQVRIYSELGMGTTISLYLPRHFGTGAEHDAVEHQAEPPRAEQGETVLLIDDEPSVRALVVEVLEDLGYIVIAAGDGPAGLAVLRSSRRIDLLVTDVGLPGGMNGRQVADAARIDRPGLQVLFITGYAESAAIGDRDLEPGMHVLTKPFSVAGLASRLKDLVESRRTGVGAADAER